MMRMQQAVKKYLLGKTETSFECQNSVADDDSMVSTVICALESEDILGAGCPSFSDRPQFDCQRIVLLEELIQQFKSKQDRFENLLEQDLRTNNTERLYTAVEVLQIGQQLEDCFSCIRRIEPEIGRIYNGITELNQKLDSEIDALNILLIGLEERIGGKIDNLREALGGLDTNMDSLKIQVSSRIDGLDTKVDDLKVELSSRIEGVDTKMVELSSRIDGLDTKVDGLKVELSSRIEGVDTKMVKLSSRIDCLDTKVDGLKVELSSRIDGLETMIRAEMGGLGNKIDALLDNMKVQAVAPRGRQSGRQRAPKALGRAATGRLRFQPR